MRRFSISIDRPSVEREAKKKKKERERAKTGDEASGSEARKNELASSPVSRTLFVLFHVRRTAKK